MPCTLQESALAAMPDQKPGQWTESLESTLPGGGFLCADQDASWLLAMVLSGLVAGVSRAHTRWEEATAGQEETRL